MISPEEQQLQICLLKTNLEDIENDIVMKRTEMPSLDAENEQKYHKTMNAVRVSRTLNTEIERLKLENVQLTAKRMQLKRQCEDAGARVSAARETREQLDDSLKQEHFAVEMEIRKYEDTLRDIAQRFRETRTFFIEEEINNEIEIINNITSELESEEHRRRDDVSRLKQEIEQLCPDVPDDILNIVGKQELEEKLKSVSEEINALTTKKEHLTKCRGNMSHTHKNSLNSFLLKKI